MKQYFLFYYMTTYPTQTSANMSAYNNTEEILCLCGNPMLMKQSNSQKNPGRWYYACPLKGQAQCKGEGSFKWCDGNNNSRKSPSAKYNSNNRPAPYTLPPKQPSEQEQVSLEFLKNLEKTLNAINAKLDVILQANSDV
jgi:hypothetical protein